MSSVLELKGINKSYLQGGVRIDVLKNTSLQINKGEVVALLGPSGCGKSTLLHIAGLLDKPNQGNISIAGKDVVFLSDYNKTLIRRHDIGFIYQSHHLLPEFTAVENVAMPLIIAGQKKLEAKKKAEEALKMLELSHRLSHRPSELSGGEQQRVAIARAIIHNPKLLLADEPTGNLDPYTAEAVIKIFISLIREKQLAALIVTHNHDIAKKMDKVFVLNNGIVNIATL